MVASLTKLSSTGCTIASLFGLSAKSRFKDPYFDFSNSETWISLSSLILENRAYNFGFLVFFFPFFVAFSSSSSSSLSLNFFAFFLDFFAFSGYFFFFAAFLGTSSSSSPKSLLVFFLSKIVGSKSISSNTPKILTFLA